MAPDQAWIGGDFATSPKTCRDPRSGSLGAAGVKGTQRNFDLISLRRCKFESCPVHQGLVATHTCGSTLALSCRATADLHAAADSALYFPRCCQAYPRQIPLAAIVRGASHSSDRCAPDVDSAGWVDILTVQGLGCKLSQPILRLSAAAISPRNSLKWSSKYSANSRA